MNKRYGISAFIGLAAMMCMLNSPALAHNQVVVVPLGGAVGDATQADVVKGKTFSSKAAGKGVIGTLNLPPTMQTYTTPTYGMTFNLIPAGTFTMGSPADEPGSFYDDEMQHQVTLTESYYMQTTEVTQQQWRDVVLAAESAGYLAVGILDEAPSNSHSGAYMANYPVEYVSWNHIRDWLNAFKQLTGKNYALPMEAQWEYAARATTTTAWPYAESCDTSADPGQILGSGFNSNLDAMGWYGFNNTTQYASGTKPVARKQANKWGLYDMQGNVHEWCQDWYDDYSGNVTDPQGPADPSVIYGSKRVIRGGSYQINAEDSRSARRFRDSLDLRLSYLGFRLVLPPGQ